MKIRILIIFIVVQTAIVKSQSLRTNIKVDSVKREFKNQGEAEDYHAEELFRKDYKPAIINKYEKPVISDGDNYYYENVIFKVGSNPLLHLVFNRGVIYPGAILAASNTHPQLKINKDSLKAWLKASPTKKVQIDNLPNSKKSILSISDFEEMKFLEKSPKQRRFRFWLFTEGFANPTVYFIELTNENASADTDMLKFIDGAKLTFIEQGWVII